MTGLQEHPGTGRTLGHQATGKLVIEDLARSLGVANVVVVDPVAESQQFEQTLRDALAGNKLSVIVARRLCLLAAGKIKKGREERGEGKGEKPEISTPHSPLPNPSSRPSPLSPLSPLPAPLSIVIAGLGGQGVLKASDILAEAAFLAGYDVKKSEVHGMSQRGGSVASDVRFGTTVFSPMVPPSEADFLIVLAEDQVENNRPRLREGGVLIAPQDIQAASLPNRRSANVALLGVLGRHLKIDAANWLEAIRTNMKPELFEVNRQAFEIGRDGAAR
jgi:indolepyruvate ferredoxin oxidoreductase beta subunit